MKDKKRIPKILKELEKVWLRYPQLRLGQLILNSLELENKDIYYVEDEDLISILKEYYCS